VTTRQQRLGAWAHVRWCGLQSWWAHLAWCSATSASARSIPSRRCSIPPTPHPVPVSTANVFGVVSLVFWSVMIIVTVTYMLLAMRVDNQGEGGIMGLITLLRRWGNGGGRRGATMLATVGIFGAALFFGDSMITPAISVLSAVEGLKVLNPSLEVVIIPVTAVIIVVLFAVQRRGPLRWARSSAR
jgi:K+ transporter